ncbi:LADA_0C05798g1_1 [Lachancea dasiensis]|uniref:Protein DML1 n=1 Tax=Lachancea dasiensis TaxID=1072105 RepID=A0A1G4IZ28_9SACH|nr:LADA_0C05798g1_1 [Lachancea dasiensis]
MREVISISASHRTNHVLTQFYNCQEQSLHSADAENDPTVFLNPTVDRISKTVSYAPRAILWDANGGAGSLGVHQYSETKDYYYDAHHKPEETDPNIKLIHTQPRIPQSEYQTALDLGLPLPELDDKNTVFWSDYAKLVFGPANLNFLNDWYHNVQDPSCPDFHNLHQTLFDNFDVGLHEFKTNHATQFFDQQLHSQLESCDGLQAINLLSEVDNGWGGFSSSLLVEMRDELPKTDVISWGFNNDDVLTLNQPIHSTRTKFQMICNKIRSSLALVRDSTLHFPIYSSPHESLWRSAGSTMLLFDAVNSVGSYQGEAKNTSLGYLIGALTHDEPHRNILSGLTAEEHDFSFYSRVPKYRTSGSQIYSKLSIARGSTPTSENKATINTSEWLPSDTIPAEYRTNSCYSVDLSVTEKPRDIFKNWFDLVSRHFKYDSDREELKEELGSLAALYEEGWYDDDDSGDDL